RMSELIDNVMDFAKGRLGGGIVLDRNAHAPLGPTLLQVVDELRTSHPDRAIEVELSIDEPVDCDRPRIGQLMSNLLGNALTHGAPELPIRLTAFTTTGALEIAIANGGSQITAAAMEKLFQPFFRGDVRPSQQGLGLGLHIASEIAKAHGGMLTATSSAEETRFVFTMPLLRG
ncbi:MAG: HAMP domain-containing histidine kinase, partial [Comamonadaceae bacterium]